ncbi:aldehyde dehydrogenase family protein [Streptomyces griseus]|uniref:aldehyde dehydrogenase family protein n=1 Tax=Streptomyces griseus TaxID=1911 RepID=UPI000D143A02|nr:aldehyde dehydrogenase family protein [Streptomyces griseus]
MRIATEENFGPVVTVAAFSSENEAVEIANGSTTDCWPGSAHLPEDDPHPHGPRRCPAVARSHRHLRSLSLEVGARPRALREFSTS